MPSSPTTRWPSAGRVRAARARRSDRRAGATAHGGRKRHDPHRDRCRGAGARAGHGRPHRRDGVLPASGRRLSARRRAGAGRHGVVQRSNPRICRPLRSQERTARENSARARRRAARRDRRARRQCLANRRRAERDRARRCQDQGRQAVPAAQGVSRRQPQHARFRQQGKVWFTGYSGIYGRADPATGKVEVRKAPKGAGPYGMTGTPGGDVWYASLAGDHIARIDTASGEATVVDPPRKGVGPSRIWSDSKGVLWVSFWYAGAIGRYDPAAKTWAIYPMPQSKSGTYSIYVDDRDRVWATDWSANAVQRFDPKTETYTTFPSDKKNANVRQMLGRPGEAWGGESGTDRLVVIRD